MDLTIDVLKKTATVTDEKRGPINFDWSLLSETHIRLFALHWMAQKVLSHPSKERHYTFDTDGKVVPKSLLNVTNLDNRSYRTPIKKWNPNKSVVEGKKVKGKKKSSTELIRDIFNQMSPEQQEFFLHNLEKDQIFGD